MFRGYVISAIALRNFKQYFTSVTGYLFVFVFVVVCAMATFSEKFFTDNLANLDSLSQHFPVLLLFFIPAITMASWADEKKQGTDAILFTLPASDLEILLGKFLSVVAVYIAALMFSLTQVIALYWIGNPDGGVIATTYVGYALAGVALLSIGLFASSLTTSTTVAFVLGALFCSLAVLMEHIFRGHFFEAYSVGGQLRDFTLGLISLPGMVFFLSITVFMLYLNLVVIGKRHWSRGQQVSLANHYVIRILSLAAVLLSLNIVAENSSAAFRTRVDLTQGSIYSLHPTTQEVIQQAVAKERPVTVQAFISRDVPRKYVAIKKRLVGLLRQYDRLGGKYIDVRFVEVLPHSQQVQEARSIGLEPRASRDNIDGRSIEQEVFLGVLMTSNFNEVLLPFLDGGTSLEYELTRSLATTTTERPKLKLGVLESDAHFGNLEIDDASLPWTADLTLKNLDKQYEVFNVSLGDLAQMNQALAAKDSTPSQDKAASSDQASTPPTKMPDVLLVADPSSLPRQSMIDLVAYLEAGQAALIMADPLPFHFFTYRTPREVGIVNAPRSPRIPMYAPFAPLAISHEPKVAGGRATPLLESLGVEWKYDRVVWNLLTPHVGFRPTVPGRYADRWPEHYGPKNKMFVFAHSHVDHQAFNAASPISQGLQELMFVYPGSLSARANSQTDFIPLVQLAPNGGGHYDWEEFSEDLVTTRRTLDRRTGEIKQITGPEENPYFGGYLRVLRKTPQLIYRRESRADEAANSSEQRFVDPEAHTLAAHIKGKGSSEINVVFVADIDFATDLIDIQQKALQKPLDNFTFLVNAIETLAGDTSFVALRNRRHRPRTLTHLEAMTAGFRRAAAEASEKTEKKISQKLADEQTKLAQRSAALQGDQELNAVQKLQQQFFQASTANKVFELRKAKLEGERENELADILTRERDQITAIENQVWWWAILSSGLPALLLGTLVLSFRWFNERSSVADNRRV